MKQLTHYRINTSNSLLDINTESAAKEHRCLAGKPLEKRPLGRWENKINNPK
jgi:hypothetical protein